MLPSLWEHLMIRLHTRRQSWTQGQSWMMKRAAGLHGSRLLLVSPLFVAAGLIGRQIGLGIQARENEIVARGLVSGLIGADIAKLPDDIQKVADQRELTNPPLQEIFQRSAPDSREHLHTALALMPDAQCEAVLRERILTESPEYFSIIAEALRPRADHLADDLWDTARNPGQDSKTRFRAACLLAQVTPDDPRWAEIADFTSKRLTRAERPVAT